MGGARRRVRFAQAVSPSLLGALDRCSLPPLPDPFCSDALKVTPSIPTAAARCTQKHQSTAVGDRLDSIEGKLQQLRAIGQAQQLGALSAWQGSSSSSEGTR